MFRCAVQSASLSKLCFDDRLGICNIEEPKIKRKQAKIECDGIMDENILKCKACEFTLGGVIEYVSTYADSIVRSSGHDLCKARFDNNDMKKVN